ncbi:MAG TPA: TonB-dependent receptor plug domain-containing protein [Paracoccaceae bacterium]|nr:TonB-dependent receptor plug domain-containing protein [Paracoccaceae bacterium]
MAGASVCALGQAFDIRGIGNADQAGVQNRIIVTVDGAVKFFEQYRTGSFFGDPELYKRVEVLRGPASSTMYGSGAIGGVVAFTTKDANDFIPEGKTGFLRLKASHATNGRGRIGTLTYAQRWGDNADILASLSRTDSDLSEAAVAQTGGALAMSFGTSDLRALDDTLAVVWAHEGAGNSWLDLEATLSLSRTQTEATTSRWGRCADRACSRFCAPIPPPTRHWRSRWKTP